MDPPNSENRFSTTTWIIIAVVVILLIIGLIYMFSGDEENELEYLGAKYRVPPE